MKVKFIDSLGALKSLLIFCEQIEYRMKSDFPEYYNRIIEYLKSRGSILPRE